jgi:hypothetical protein
VTTRPVADLDLDLDLDLQEVLAVHRTWWEANEGFDIAKMRRCFAQGEHFMMFNLNGFPYFSVDELTRLWEFLREHAVDFRDVTTRVVRHERRGDTIWLAIEAQAWHRGLGAHEFVPRVIRATEIYHRDSGNGDADWRMWHFHCSDHAATDRPRMGFSDTFHDRGLGGNPYSEAVVGVPAERRTGHP